MNKHQQCRVGAYLFHSSNRPSKGAFSDLHLVDTQDEGIYGENPVIHGRVSDHKLCGEPKHGHTIFNQMFTIWLLGWVKTCLNIPHSEGTLCPPIHSIKWRLSNSKKIGAF
jgi:hypothetical protein